MMNRRIALAPSVLLVLLAAAMAGCGSSPKRNFYTLQASPPQSTRSILADPSQPSLAVGPVTLPEVVDRAQIVVRTSDNRLDISDQNRWAEPLQGEIASVLAADLARELGLTQVAVQGQGTAGEPDIRVAVDVLRFESVLGGAATIEASWMVRRKGTNAPVRGRSVAREAAQGGDYEALAAAHTKALARIARDIAAVVRAGRE
jgi:uncharacterized lipoprotein YmbA